MIKNSLIQTSIVIIQRYNSFRKTVSYLLKKHGVWSTSVDLFSFVNLWIQKVTTTYTCTSYLQNTLSYNNELKLSTNIYSTVI